MKNENIQIRHVVGHSLNLVFPLTMVYMCYIILHGHLSPGGGFQGGVLIVGAFLMIYFANGYQATAKAISFNLLHEAEGVASVAYVALAMMGIAVGACRHQGHDRYRIHHAADARHREPEKLRNEVS